MRPKFSYLETLVFSFIQEAVLGTIAAAVPFRATVMLVDHISDLTLPYIVKLGPSSTYQKCQQLVHQCNWNRVSNLAVISPVYIMCSRVKYQSVVV